jgi:hypothetical protein
MIITGNKKQKKYYDKQGNEINDPTLIQDIQRGATVYSIMNIRKVKNQGISFVSK